MLCVHCSTPVADNAKFCHSCGSMVSDAEGQAAATAAMDMSAFAHMERMLREDTKGEFVVKQMLGRGGMAVVYLAEETKLGRKVALKVLPPELTFGHGVDRFLREAKTAATLDHPHIIPIYRIAAEGKLFWYAMKYLEGTSLEDVLREKGTFSLAETIVLLEQVADALDYAHEHQVIHRDIKPANIMLDSRSRVIVTDFGIAKALSEGALTASGSVIGTPYFMSPEQGMGKPVSGASDQYSVGVMAFRMLAGHVPYDGDSAIDILHKHCMMEIPRLETTAPHMPKHVCDAIEKAMAKKAPERFKNIDAFVKALKEPSAAGMRPSKTLMIDSGELEQVNAASAKLAARGGAKGARPGSAAAAAATVVASPPAGSRAVAAPAAKPAAKSKAPLWAAIAAVVVIGGGAGAYAMFGKTDGLPEPSPSIAALPPDAGAPVGAPTPASGDAVTGGTGAAGDSPPTPVQATATQPDPAPPTVREPATTPQRQPTAQRPPSTPPARPPQQQAAPVTPPVTAVPTLAMLQLIISPPGDVSINGVSRGERARHSEQLSAGQHQVRVERPGYATKDTILTMRGGDTLRVTLRLEERP